MVSLGTASAAPGEVDTGRLQVGETRDGSPFGLPVAVVNGAEDGETLYMQAASDGDELNGVGVVQRVLPSCRSGGAVGDDTGRRHRQLPRLPGGRAPQPHRRHEDEPGLPRRRERHLLRAHRRRDVPGGHARRPDPRPPPGVDLADAGGVSGPLRAAPPAPRRVCLELAKAFGCGYVLDQKGPDGQLARAAPDEGIPTIDPELGAASAGTRAPSRPASRACSTSCGTTTSSPVATRRRPRPARPVSTSTVRPPAAWSASRRAWATGSRGDALYRITDVFGEVKATVTADAPGIFWRSWRLPQVATGEYICSVGTDVDSV